MKLLYKNSARLTRDDIVSAAEQAVSYAEVLQNISRSNEYVDPESAINTPFDDSFVQAVADAEQRVYSPVLKYVLVIGMGGSSAGARAVYDALHGHFDLLERTSYPKILFLNTTDARFLSKVSAFLERDVAQKEEVLINVVSKSGTTVETIAQAEYLLTLLTSRFADPEDRVVVTTDTESRLWNYLEGKNIVRLGVPKLVGGRFSVFTPVGLFPLMHVGLSGTALLDGAQHMRGACLRRDAAHNPALLSAVITYLHNTKHNVSISDTFLFNPELESLGGWYRQLLAESVGKEREIGVGNTVPVGITPTVSCGPRDLHSTGQLTLGGPRDKFTTFVWSEASEGEAAVPAERWLPTIAPEVTGKSFADITRAILEGTKTAYQEKELPFVEVVLEDISERALGEFLMFKMMEVMYLGKLLGVDAFNQPHVELYKKETKALLDNKTET